MRCLVEVVRANLEQLLVCAFLQPVGELLVVVGAGGLGERGVRDLADQHVLEAVRDLAREAGVRLSRQEIADEQVVERVVEIVAEVGRQRGEGRVGEDAPEDGRALKQDLRAAGQAVDASSDQRLQRVGDPVVRPVVALEHHPHGLLDEERIAFGDVEQMREDRFRDLLVLHQRVGELLALFAWKRLELDRRRAHAPPAPSGPHVEQLRARKADDEERALAHPLREMVDQLEQRLFGPVDVLEDEHERLDVRELVDELARRPRNLRLAPLVLDRLEHARGQTEQLGDRFLAAALEQLLARRLDRIVVADSGGRLHHLREGPVRDALPVRKRASREDGHSFRACEELAHQAALPHARIAVDGEHVRAPVSDRPLQRVVQQVELRVAPDERRRNVGDAVTPVAHANRAKRGNRLAESAQLERPCRLRLDRRAGEPMRGLSDQDLARASSLLQPRRHVDGLAGRERRVGLVHHDLAGLDADPRLERELAHVVDNRERSSDRPLRVVFVRLRDSERGHHGVPGELLHRPAVRLDAPGHTLEEGRDPPAHDLRVGAGHEVRVVDEVDEEDGRQLPFHT